MFSVLMINQIGCHVDNTNVVAEHNSNLDEGMTQFLKKLAQPGSLSNGIGNGTVLGLWHLED